MTPQARDVDRRKQLVEQLVGDDERDRAAYLNNAMLHYVIDNMASVLVERDLALIPRSGPGFEEAVERGVRSLSRLGLRVHSISERRVTVNLAGPRFQPHTLDANSKHAVVRAALLAVL